MAEFVSIESGENDVVRCLKGLEGELGMVVVDGVKEGARGSGKERQAR